MNASSQDLKLYDIARRHKERAHAPYSRYTAGVALETMQGEMIGGCNIECVDYLGLEAAEVALARLVTQQDWRSDLESIRLSRVVFAVPHIDRESYTFMPSPQSLGRLRFFSHYDIPLLFIDEKGREEGFMLERLLPICPNIDEAMQSFHSTSQIRKNDATLPVRNTDIGKMLTTLHRHSIAPASHYCVSSVIESEDGGIYGGVNIETSAHNALHAEESAIANMVCAEGSRARIKNIYVHSSGQQAGWPCGNCRQKLLEFATEDSLVIVTDGGDHLLQERLQDLLPHGFTAAHIG